MNTIFIDGDTLLLCRRIIFKCTRCFGCLSILVLSFHLFGDIFGIIVERVPCDVQPVGHKQGDGCEQEVHLEGSEVGGPPATEVVEDQLAGTQEMIDNAHAEVEEKWRREQEQRQQAEVLAKIEADRRRENAPGKERTLSDFYVTFPFGNFDFSVGYVDNHFGWKFKDNQDGSVLIGRMVGNETKSYRVFRTLAEQPTPPNEQLKGWVDGLVQSALGALLGETRSEPFQWMVGAANGMRGKLLQTDGTRYEGTTRDSAGNIVPEKVSEQTGSVDSILWGSISVTKRRTQIGTHVRKQSLATFPMPFEGNYLGISFTVGQSSD